MADNRLWLKVIFNNTDSVSMTSFKLSHNELLRRNQN